MIDLSTFWSAFIIVLAGAGIIGCFLLVYTLTEKKKAGAEKVKTTGHVWDEDLEEYNNPLPKWWLNLFYITLVFGVIYLVIYPGMGTWQGVIKWTQVGQYEGELKAAEKQYGPLYDKFRKEDLQALAANPEAMKVGERLFANYCTSCHGSDARGATGFPNLRDNDWLYGGDPETIKASIMNGRTGVMPAWGAMLGNEGAVNVAEYVLSLSGRKHDPESARLGKEKFDQVCAACHGPTGKGNPAMGAANLTDSVWLYGGSQKTIIKTISEGRQGRMPAHAEFLGENKVHVLAAYVYGLSLKEKQAKQP